MKQGRCKGDIFFAPAEGEIRCAGILLLNLLPHFSISFIHFRLLHQDFEFV